MNVNKIPYMASEISTGKISTFSFNLKKSFEIEKSTSGFKKKNTHTGEMPLTIIE